ncbi:DNA polymerase III subunit delta' [Desulfosarcina ovata]|uniref:DNA polymerase III subunit delta' n=2 Tax=Desulfosarcina ovata TaxID=83564 RepID=A0A5K8ABM4_9BACT|nr:DNA polymerase III subunit delta' [Desulfosarcina ovata]BBO82145.1 DNA polymerase III subunit delta' [Desulfosarcina ovata subsp. sediminis]BBO89350.1 DNA polymerase III subunit delta' [Desulfosarcina ovata subsp. ovata]
MTTATGFDAIVGQEPPIRLLKTFIRKGTHPHALLFTGDNGVGKKMTATVFAMACNCLALKATLGRQPCTASIDPASIEACGACSSCRKIIAGQHPDILHIAPQSSVIRIDQIRILLQTLTLKPNEAAQRVVIISDAQAMNPEAGNALLKILEEPPDGTLLVLTAPEASDLLPTVVSRCRQIRFRPLAAEDIARMLTASEEIDPQTAQTTAALCGGSYTRALTLIDPRWQKRRAWVIETLNRLATQPSGSVRGWLAFSEKLAAKKDLIEEWLEIITMWLRDLLVAGVDPIRVLNQDRLGTLTTAAGQVGRARLLEQIDAVDDARVALRSNTNARLTLDAMVLKMAGVGNSYV